MNKTFKIYFILLVIVIALLTILQFNKSTIIDWRKNFRTDNKDPFGLYIFDQEIEDLLGDGVQRITKTPYQFYTEDSISEPHNILMINQDLTEEGLDKVLDRVAQGDNLMYISEYVDYVLQDKLRFSLLYSSPENSRLELLDYKYIQDSVYINRIPSARPIYKIDTTTTKILGIEERKGYGNEYKSVNFIQVKYGKGNIFIHTEPLFLTNYYLLNGDDYKYTEDVFSYLPKRKTIWFLDSYEVVSQSPLRFILKEPPLRYAWYLALSGLVLFMIFNAKRRQRVVPIIEPNKNLSVEFVQTIGNLYLQESDNKDMAHKKVTYFLNRVRTELLIDTQHLDDVFWRRIKLKTGAKDKDIKKVIPLIEKALHPQAPVQESELIELTLLLNKIYN